MYHPEKTLLVVNIVALVPDTGGGGGGYPEILILNLTFCSLLHKKSKKGVCTIRKNVRFCKIVVLVRVVFTEFMDKFSHFVLFFGQATKKRVLPDGKTVTFCQNYRSGTGGFY